VTSGHLGSDHASSALAAVIAFGAEYSVVWQADGQRVCALASAAPPWAGRAALEAAAELRKRAA